MLSDLNGGIGQQDNSKIVSHFGEDAVNDKRVCIVDVCKQRELKVFNGLHQHKDSTDIFWFSPLVV